MPMPIDAFRNSFPALASGIYANTASCGAMPQKLLDWRCEQERDLGNGASAHFEHGLKVIESSRTKLCQFLDCEAHQLAFVPNFSLGMNLLLQLLHKDHTVLLVEEDYPSVNWPFEHSGFHVEKVSVSGNLEAHLEEKISTGQIDVLAVSVVQWLSGTFLDLGLFKQLKQAYPELIIIADGTQYCGMFPFGFKDSGVDVLLASGYKWMLSGYGNGFMVFEDGFMEKHLPKSIGFGSVRGNMGAKDNIPFCHYFEAGHLDSLAFGSLGISVDFFGEVGMDAISEQNQLLSDHFKQRFLDLGLLPSWVAQRKKHSTIFNVKLNGNLVGRLREKGIMCSQRGGGTRFSFHFYNTIEDIDRIAEVVKW